MARLAVKNCGPVFISPPPGDGNSKLCYTYIRISEGGKKYTVRNNNTQGKTEFITEHIFWLALAWIWYRSLLFRCVPQHTLTESKLILLGFVLVFSAVGILFQMDIDMPGRNGIEASRALRERNQSIVLLFVTNLAQYAIAGYEVDALDYILKPINYFSFKLKIQKALETVRRVQGTLLTIASDHGQQLVRDSEIFYIEVQGHNLIYHTLHGDLTATGTLKQIEAQLKPSGFYRCNYCYLVNLRHVGFLDGSEVTVGQYKLQISRNRRKEFLQQLTQFYGRGGR